jgi:hypothetical protein
VPDKAASYSFRLDNGSTNNAVAVCLTEKQQIAGIKHNFAARAYSPVQPLETFLNWTKSLPPNETALKTFVAR